jgi:NDP-sugar pyrophosphorylase family protein
LTIASYRRIQKIDFGVLDIDQEKETVKGFREKPEYEYNVSMGIYVMNKSILEFIPNNSPFGFDDLLLVMLKNNKPVYIFPYNGYWLDIGRPEDYDKANEDIQLLNKIL